MTVIINTWKRERVFARTLSRLLDLKESETKVVVIEDSETTRRITKRAEWISIGSHVGVGMARRFAFEYALRSDDSIFMFLDNDMLVERGFDSDGLLPWLEYRGSFKRCFGSSYRQFSDIHLDRELRLNRFGDAILGTSFPGACLVSEKPLISFCLEKSEIRWDQWWDWWLIAFVGFCIRPRISFMEHIGNDDIATHK